MNYEIVTQQSVLNDVCTQAAQKEIIMLDTEFVRTRTLYPDLGLVQLYDGERLSLIDTVALSDLTPLWQLLSDTSITKVLHACSEDLEVFLHESGRLPVNMHDTQVMAAFLGYSVSTGFAKLVEDYLGVTLDKGESRTNWMARPLTEKQEKYAAADVFYLYPLYEKLLKKVKERGYLDALQQECEQILEKKAQPINQEHLYTRIKQSWRLEPEQLAVLKELCIWRYKRAQNRNLALNFVIHEDDLWKVAFHRPQDFVALQALNINEYALKRHANALLKIVAQVDLVSRLDDPEKIIRLTDNPQYKTRITELKKIVNKKAEESGLASEFIASKKLLNQYLKWCWFDDKNPDKKPTVLRSWRAKLLKIEE